MTWEKSHFCGAEQTQTIPGIGIDVLAGVGIGIENPSFPGWSSIGIGITMGVSLL